MAKGRDTVTSAADDMSEIREEDIWDFIENDEVQKNEEIVTDHHYYVPNKTQISTRTWDKMVQDLPANGLSSMLRNKILPPSPGILHRNPKAVNSYYRECGLGSSSAPVNVPVWPKFLRVDCVGETEAGDDEDISDWIPPHEYLARENDRRSVAGSVFEGAGRTLKGRDMSRVRDAVWSQTGFFG